MKFYLLFSLLIIPLELLSLNLYELDPNKEYLKSGQKLMDLDFGLHDLEANQIGKEILISIHGRDSRGFEWIYPLQTIDNEFTKTFFFRWDTTKCPQKTIPILVKEILAMKDIEKITILGHSYGGILVTHLLKNWNLITPLEIHVVASPLLGTPMLNSMCGYEPISLIPKNSVLYEWRTQHKLDNVFKDLSEDPQKIQLKESYVTTLPEAYKSNRLGHNWSISWVADEAF